MIDQAESIAASRVQRPLARSIRSSRDVTMRGGPWCCLSDRDVESLEADGNPKRVWRRQLARIWLARSGSKSGRFECARIGHHPSIAQSLPHPDDAIGPSRLDA